MRTGTGAGEPGHESTPTRDLRPVLGVEVLTKYENFHPRTGPTSYTLTSSLVSFDFCFEGKVIDLLRKSSYKTKKGKSNFKGNFPKRGETVPRVTFTRLIWTRSGPRGGEPEEEPLESSRPVSRPRFPPPPHYSLFLPNWSFYKNVRSRDFFFFFVDVGTM